MDYYVNNSRINPLQVYGLYKGYTWCKTVYICNIYKHVLCIILLSEKKLKKNIQRKKTIFKENLKKFILGSLLFFCFRFFSLYKFREASMFLLLEASRVVLLSGYFTNIIFFIEVVVVPVSTLVAVNR